MENINQLFDELFYKVRSVKWKGEWMAPKGKLTPLIKHEFITYTDGQLAMIDCYGRKAILTLTQHGHIIINERFSGGAGGKFDICYPEEFSNGELDRPISLELLKKVLGIGCKNIGIIFKRDKTFNTSILEASMYHNRPWSFNYG